MTQRWKVMLRMGANGSFPTKVEFSRRRDRIRYSTGVPDAQLLDRYKLSPFAAQFYGARIMSAQKIAALAAPARNALRDLFDLHHLFFSIGAKPEEVSPFLGPGMAEAAAEKVMAFSFAEFKEQVVPYLTAELMDLYRDPSVFDRQVVYGVTSAMPRKYSTALGEFRFHHLPKRLVWGFESRQAGAGRYLVAEREKAFLDMIYLALSPRSPLQLPHKRGRRWDLDKAKLSVYARRFSHAPLDAWLKDQGLV